MRLKKQFAIKSKVAQQKQNQCNKKLFKKLAIHTVS